MRKQIIDQLSDKVSEGWNMIDTTYIRVNNAAAIVSPANDDDKRRYQSPGNWIYPGIYTIEFKDKLYRITF